MTRLHENSFNIYGYAFVRGHDLLRGHHHLTDSDEFPSCGHQCYECILPYLIVQHMEPDHSANINNFAKLYPEVKIVASKKAFAMMKNFFGTEFEDRRIIVGDGDALTLGKRTLKFFTAPMVHWPEVIVTYDPLTKTLFSADGFGKFGALDADEDWACEARRYYFGIVGKYGAQVQALLKKAASLEIERICPLHGPILSENLSYYINLYNIWSSYGVETEGVMIAFTDIPKKP